MTVAALNLILLLGAVVRDLDSIRPALDWLIHLTDLTLVVSSSLLDFWAWRSGRRLLGIVFGLNLVAFAVAAGLRPGGYIFPPLVLFAADLYWLNLYLVCLARHWELIYRAEG